MLGSKPYTGPERRKAVRWRPRPVRLLLTLFVLVVVGYMSVVIWLMTQETRLVFQAGATLGAARPSFPFDRSTCLGPTGSGSSRGACRRVRATMHRGCCSCTATRRRSPRTSTSRTSVLLKSVGVNILAPEYRGFSGLDGTPTEETLAVDARAAYDYLRGAATFPHRGSWSTAGRWVQPWPCGWPPRSNRPRSFSKGPRPQSPTSASSNIRSFPFAW